MMPFHGDYPSNYPGEEPLHTFESARQGELHSLDKCVELFAEAWTYGLEADALAYAKLATARHGAMYHPSLENQGNGCPEADEAQGWLGWAQAPGPYDQDQGMC